MSYILDALKKIEHEKTRKARPDGRISISGDLFQERKQPAIRAGIWKIMVLITVASLVTGAGTWYLLRGSSKNNVAIVRPAAPPLPVTVNPSVAPLPIQSQIIPVDVLPAAPPAAVPVMPKNAATVADDDSSPRAVRRSNKQTLTQPPSPRQPVQAVPAPADIKLSGIAWQEERSLRRVVINGFLLKEGAVVSGGKITDILVDRVRLSSPAGIFEVKLDAVLPAEVQR